MRIYRHPDLHLNANVAALARNRGNEEHYSGSTTIIQLYLVISWEQHDLHIQQLGGHQWALWSCIPKPPLHGHAGCLVFFPRDAGMVMDQAIVWNLLGTSTAKAMREGTQESLILGSEAARFPRVPQGDGHKEMSSHQVVIQRKPSTLCWTLPSPPALCQPSPTTNQPSLSIPIHLPTRNYGRHQLNPWLPPTTHPVV